MGMWDAFDDEVRRLREHKQKCNDDGMQEAIDKNKNDIAKLFKKLEEITDILKEYFKKE